MLKCSSLLVMINFLLRGYTILPRKELHSSLWVNSLEWEARQKKNTQHFSILSEPRGELQTFLVLNSLGFGDRPDKSVRWDLMLWFRL